MNKIVCILQANKVISLTPFSCVNKCVCPQGATEGGEASCLCSEVRFLLC